MRQDGGHDDPHARGLPRPPRRRGAARRRGRWRAPRRRATGWSLVVATDGDAGLASREYARRRPARRRVGWTSCAGARSRWACPRRVASATPTAASGPQPHPDPPGPDRFVRADVDEAAERLAAILREERADVLLTYDRNGGYGHRDHVQVHEVGARAAELAGTPRVLEATVPRDTICRAVDARRAGLPLPAGVRPRPRSSAPSAPASEITHRIDVRRYAAAKRASMRAHASQASAEGGADRTLAAFLRIPRPLYDLVFGREWFVDPARARRAPGVARHLRGPGVSAGTATGARGDRPQRAGHARAGRTRSCRRSRPRPGRGPAGLGPAPLSPRRLGRGLGGPGQRAGRRPPWPARADVVVGLYSTRSRSPGRCPA